MYIYTYLLYCYSKMKLFQGSFKTSFLKLVWFKWHSGLLTLNTHFRRYSWEFLFNSTFPLVILWFTQFEAVFAPLFLFLSFSRTVIPSHESNSASDIKRGSLGRFFRFLQCWVFLCFVLCCNPCQPGASIDLDDANGNKRAVGSVDEEKGSEV